MAGKKIDTGLAKESFAKLNKLNELQKTEDGKLFPLMTDVGAWWSGKSADALESRAAQMFESVKTMLEDISKDLAQAQTYVEEVILKDRQYAANMLAAFGSGNSITEKLGTVGQGASKGMESMEFKNWLSKVTGVTADTSALKEYFSKSGRTLEEIYWIYLGLTRNGVTETHVANLQKIGYSFDDVVMDYSRITKITDKEIYSLMLQGGDYFDAIEEKNPGSWKGMLTGITAGGELNQDTKISLISYEEGIGAYYKEKNVNGYSNYSKEDNALTASSGEKKLFNLCFEAVHPEHATSIDGFFAQDKAGAEKYKDQVVDIKFLAYSAPESYRTVFLDNIGKIGIGTLDFDESTGAQNYNPGDKKLYVNLGSANTTESGPYQTFFHECGHGIDDLLKDEGSLSTEYSKNSVTIKEAMINDTENWIRSEIQKYGLSEQEQGNVIRNLIVWERNQAERNGQTGLTGIESKARDHVISTFKSHPAISTEVGGIPSDIYGAMTGDVLVGYHSHAGMTDYWKSDYTTPGNASTGGQDQVQYKDNKMAEKEFFAENFAAEMVGDQKSLDSVNKFLPGSKAMVDELIEDISVSTVPADQSERYDPSVAKRP